MNAVDPQLERAWFQPLDLSNEKLLSNFAFKCKLYRYTAGPIAHKETPHYNAWREAVGDMMEAPRVAEKYVPIYPWRGSTYKPFYLSSETVLPIK